MHCGSPRIQLSQDRSDHHRRRHHRIPSPHGNSGPAGITAGPDGALWFAEVVGNKIGRITTDGIGLAWNDESLRQQFGGIAEFVRPGVLGGSDEEVVDAIGRYVDAGADQVNIALRAPWDIPALERLAPLLGST